MGRKMAGARRCVCGRDRIGIRIAKLRLVVGATFIAGLAVIGWFGIVPGFAMLPVAAVLVIALFVTVSYYLVRGHRLDCALRIALVQMLEGLASPIPG